MMDLRRRRGPGGGGCTGCGCMFVVVLLVSTMFWAGCEWIQSELIPAETAPEQTARTEMPPEKIATEDPATEEVMLPGADILHFRWGDTFEQVRDVVEQEYGAVLELDTNWTSTRDVKIALAEHQISMEDLAAFGLTFSESDYALSDGAFPLGTWPPRVNVRYGFEQDAETTTYHLYYTSLHISNLSRTSMKRCYRFIYDAHGKPDDSVFDKMKIGTTVYPYDYYLWRTPRSLIDMQFLFWAGRVSVDWRFIAKPD